MSFWEYLATQPMYIITVVMVIAVVLVACLFKTIIVKRMVKQDAEDEKKALENAENVNESKTLDDDNDEK